MRRETQGVLFQTDELIPPVAGAASSTFANNMTLPVHRWFRYSAGFSAAWVESVIADAAAGRGDVRVFDPFAGSATTLVEAENAGVESWGIDAHPFISRIAMAKLAWRSEPEAYLAKIKELKKCASVLTPDLGHYPELIRRCYDDQSLARLDVLRRACEAVADGTEAAGLAWLTLVAILRKVSHAGTAQWQYVLPKKQKVAPADPDVAFDQCWRMIHQDMHFGRGLMGPRAHFLQSDARTCQGVPKRFATLVVTSPPYPNNYDYADATRLEMCFLGQIAGWADLQTSVRRHLVRSCSQHVPEKSVCLAEVLDAPELAPVSDELSGVCEELGTVRLSRGGRKTYHLMVACYFRDLALVWHALRGVCATPSTVCFVIGDSAPYGVYVPVVPWLGRLAQAAGFDSYSFEKTRDRNIKWKNRKHRVPLLEGRLWVKG